MRITSTFDISKSASNGEIFIHIDDVVYVISPTDNRYPLILNFYGIVRKANANDRATIVSECLENLVQTLNGSAETNVTPPTPTMTDAERKKATISGLSALLHFCKEFEFVPNYRFVNTVANRLAISAKDAKDYIENYFRLTDSPYANIIGSKMRSDEFNTILDKLSLTAPTKNINDRFSIYYGNAGTGKTTQAQAECDGRCVVCNNSMLPSDLMEDFIFVEGKPSFKPSALWECMEQGKSITLDEINLLPFDSLRFLQGILDGKKEFLYKGHTVTIADGFKIIGTMNLVVNGAVFNLPEPLVDRCAQIVEYKLTASNLYSAF